MIVHKNTGKRMSLQDFYKNKTLAYISNNLRYVFLKYGISIIWKIFLNLKELFQKNI